MLIEMTRARALALIGGALALVECGRRDCADIKIGYKDFAESVTLAEIYAASLEYAGYTAALKPIEHRDHIDQSQTAKDELRKGAINLYPEYTGTALTEVLNQGPPFDPCAGLATLKKRYAQWNIEWLLPSDAQDAQALVVTPQVFNVMRVRTLSECARAARHMRFAAISDFLDRNDGLCGLQRYYGGFRFAAPPAVYPIGEQYEALTSGEVEVAAAFTTDPQVAKGAFMVLDDDRHFWPRYFVTPVVCKTVATSHPRLAPALNGVRSFLSTSELCKLNIDVMLPGGDPAVAARDFVRAHRQRLDAAPQRLVQKHGGVRCE